MGGIVSCVSNLMYLSEKITLYVTCTVLICCLMLTITVTLGMGIGLGYNYCFVDMKTKFKYIEGHYIYPGSPRWPNRKRQGDAVEEPAFDETAEDDALRRTPDEPDDQLTAIPGDIDREYLLINNSDNGTVMGYHPTSFDLESFNESSEKKSSETTVAAATTDGFTEISEDSSETNPSISFPKSSSITEDDTKILDKADEPTSELPNVNEEKPKSSPNSRKVKKLVIPISGLDLISLLSKLKAENKNYSLQIVTT